MPDGDLPAHPQTWREFRAGLRALITRAELTASAIERMATGPTARGLGLDAISDATIGRKIADRDAPVDARSVRIIVTACRIAAERRGIDLAGADVIAWSRARERVAQAPGPEPTTDATPSGRAALSPASAVPLAMPPSQQPARRGWLAGTLAIALLVAGGTGWFVTRPHQPPQRPATAPSANAAAATTDDLTAGTPPCRNPPDKPAGPGLSMTAPQPGTVLTGDQVEARGTVQLSAGERPPWLLLYAIGICRFYLGTPVVVSGGNWKGTLYFDPTQPGGFVAYAMVVDAAVDGKLRELAAASRSPFLVRLPPSARVVHVTVHCCG